MKHLLWLLAYLVHFRIHVVGEKLVAAPDFQGYHCRTDISLIITSQAQTTMAFARGFALYLQKPFRDYRPGWLLHNNLTILLYKSLMFFWSDADYIVTSNFSS